ncbi:hypothetical protein HDIA_4764 [Hartmannibacter diazotrophicus]|uniref:DUF6984 domain-containing protein n=1 Tax=Hartmannibacter diazotrophicus TaxID=1482074 RepID=A0A2C9DEE0_9HYPH|nr:hypothetical protein [Hartmannibacter diazotrophicus]SON58305.1 hypothetical protein HDIA_4764 [Hartmannibacter diazotrophicus]
MRPVTDRERSLLEALFAHLPAIESSLLLQLAAAKVTELDEEGSLKFHIAPSFSIEINERVPVTGTIDDIDGVPIFFLLHVVGGKIDELEIYKADGSTILTEIVADALRFDH